MSFHTLLYFIKKKEKQSVFRYKLAAIVSGMEIFDLHLAYGMNPFGNLSSSNSAWTVLLSIYNLPPWFCNKRKYIMMSILISDPHHPSNCIGVYLRQLVDDLKLFLPPGIKVLDAYKRKTFTLRGMFLHHQ
jgi:hypothetical protein